MQRIRESLDAALAHTTAIEVAGLATGDIRDALESALGAVYGAVQAGHDAGAVRDRCAVAIGGARVALEKLQEVDTDDESTHAAMASTAAAMGALLRRDFSVVEGANLPRAGTPTPPPATVAEPRTIDVTRPLVPPAVALPTAPTEPAIEPPAPEEPSPVETMEALEALMAETMQKLATFDAGVDDEPEEESPSEPLAAPDEGLTEHFARANAEHFGRLVSRDEQIDVYAEYLFEDIGMLGIMRRHRDIEGTTWLGRATAEQRLLKKLDAMIACGVQRIPALVRMLDDRPLPDPELTWALVFICGCLAGDDAGDQLVRTVRTADLAMPEMRESLADALAIVPEAAAVGFLDDWLVAPELEKRVIALEVLGRRRTLARERIEEAVESGEPALMKPALRALARTDLPVRPGTWLRALSHEDHDVVELAFQAGLIRVEPVALDRGFALCEEGRPEHGNAVLYAVIGGDEARARRALERALASSGALVVLESVGHSGDMRFVPLLLGALLTEHGAMTAAVALNRITGANLVEGEEIPTLYPEGERPFERAFRPREEVLNLATAPEAWNEWLRLHGGLSREGIRYRRGHAWSVIDAVYELEHERASRRERRLSHAELAMRSGFGFYLDQDAFVSRQLRQLDAIRLRITQPLVDKTTGRWPSME